MAALCTAVYATSPLSFPAVIKTTTVLRQVRLAAVSLVVPRPPRACIGSANSSGPSGSPTPGMHAGMDAPRLRTAGKDCRGWPPYWRRGPRRSCPPARTSEKLAAATLGGYTS